MLDSRALLLRAALGFTSLEPRDPELRLLHHWLDSWSGIGHVVAGMARQGYDLELRRYDGLAGYVLPERLRALADVPRRKRMGPEPVGRGAHGGT